MKLSAIGIIILILGGSSKASAQCPFIFTKINDTVIVGKMTPVMEAWTSKDISYCIFNNTRWVTNSNDFGGLDSWTLYCVASHVGVDSAVGWVSGSHGGGPHCSCDSAYGEFSVRVFAVEPTSFVLDSAESINQVYFQHSRCIISVRDPATVRLALYDLTGRLVRQINRDVPAGTSEIDLGMSSLPAGCYWYVVHAGGWSKSGKVMKLP